ncbi:NAD-dependent epimerase/dehydratase [Trichormus variabilis ATCC 29413]|uniref:NAD-dependent epimerase/dehydratase n=2 Tax=Anabaena variabilis TaxID=264691 RepID=Q3MB72_TRIV2|nr:MULTISPECIES: SDR family oxidoreductase [Nostocaceae]ABA21764.1 NAD-dependent epimerase/dehydratase [Trichormus variabilis ATCC 29413]MBC1215424.1 SDR family oxidoreductase [Trichormus variabilis ARAD]MBC1255509.1 SDR family oxidoreductase [Trichormus variabilis V5]MBC1267609.1 SDR family oxidoreductase [Trichormus variabilis FSR]MBC1304039.1 SDR family oxidoreductase [Trichormus variabilis N2B]
MTNSSHIFLVGASRGVGREIANYLTSQNLKVTALLRSEASRPELEAIGVQVVLGDALNASDVERATLTDEPIHTVISTLGGLPTDAAKPDYPGNKNLIDAALKAGAQKFILVTSIGTGNSVEALSPQVLAVLGPVLVEKDKAEQHLIASGLTYTIIRPGGLKSEPSTGNGILTEDTRIIGSIHRADVARLVIECLNSERANNKILSAVDKNMLFTKTDFIEFSLD